MFGSRLSWEQLGVIVVCAAVAAVVLLQLVVRDMRVIDGASLSLVSAHATQFAGSAA